MKNLLLLISLSLTTFYITEAQSDGPKISTTYSANGSGASWSNLSGVAAIDNSPAYADLAQHPTCNNFMCYYSNVATFSGFGFNIPLSATITGIQLNIMQRVSSPGGGIHDSSLVLTVGGVSYGDDYKNDSNWFDTPTIRTYGGPSDTWNHTWTPQQVNDPTFGFRYRLTNSSYDQPASVDYLTMTVYYQAGTGFYSPTSTSLDIGVSNNTLVVSGSLSSTNEGCILEVSDILGKVFYKKEIEADNLSIYSQTDLSSWARGTYIVNVSRGTRITTKKIVLRK
jgi:hypothetical protein